MVGQALIPAKADSPEIEDNLHWVRLGTLEVLLGALAALAWLAIVPYLSDPSSFWPGWGEPLAILLTIVVCTSLKRASYRLASGLLIVGLFVVITLRTLGGSGSDPLAPFLYVPLVLIAATLQGSLVAVATALVATAMLLTLSIVPDKLGADIGVTLHTLIAIWLATLTSWLTTRNLVTTLSWLWQSQQEAHRHLAKAQHQHGELAAALRQLEDATYRLERMNYALNWARLEAEEARRLKAQFAAHVSHELRTPINLIAGFSDLMLNNPKAYGAPLPAPYLSDLQTLHRSAKHLQGLIDDILDLSQLDAKEMPLMRETVEVQTVIGDAVATIRQLLERKNLAVGVEIAPEVTTAYLDPLRVRQVLLNLLSNASRHTTAGGIAIRAWVEREHVAISVADTGDGIDPREIPHLFEPFHRLADGASPHEGWGLGLAICKQFVELHGGTITAASEGVPGRGTTFTIRLPRHARPAEPPAQPSQSGRTVERLRAVASSPAVVVLEADPHVVNLYRRHLSTYRVEAASGESEALELARSISAHALLVNLPSPEEHVSWSQRWWRLGTQHSVRVIGCSMPGSRQLAQTVGLADFLVKPVTRETLLATIERANPRARTIAVIDDEPAMVRLLSRMLRASERRFEVIRAFDGQEGLELILRKRPDVILLDLVMPRVGGFSLLEILRNDPELADIAVVAVSAKGATEVFAAPDGRQLTFIADRSLTITEMLRGIRALLDCLPPTSIGETGSVAAHRVAPTASEAS